MRTAEARLRAFAVQVCPYGHTCGGRRLSDKCRTVVSKEGFPDSFKGTPSKGEQMQSERWLFSAPRPRATSGVRAWQPSRDHQAGKGTPKPTKAQPQEKSLRSRLLFCGQKSALTEFPLQLNAADGRHQCVMIFWIFKRASHCSPKAFRSCFCETSVDDMRQ